MVDMEVMVELFIFDEDCIVLCYKMIEVLCVFVCFLLFIFEKNGMYFFGFGSMVCLYFMFKIYSIMYVIINREFNMKDNCVFICNLFMSCLNLRCYCLCKLGVFL